MHKKSTNTTLIYIRTGLIFSLVVNAVITFLLYKNYAHTITDVFAVGFFLNILSTIVIATVLAFLIKRDDPLEPLNNRIDEIVDGVKNLSVMRKLILPNVTKDFDGIADDIYQVNNLIEKNKATRVPPETYIREMMRARSDYNSSYHIFPVTFLSLDGFYAEKAVGGQWFEFEFNYLKNPQNQKKDIKRILIIEDELQNRKETGIFLKKALNHNCCWRYINKSNLSNEELRFFRNFALFYNTQPAELKIAFFTYLDIKNMTMFTKSSWVTYRTFDKEYMLKLKEDFEFLWERCIDIKNFQAT